jgi:hypothetical protein
MTKAKYIISVAVGILGGILVAALLVWGFNKLYQSYNIALVNEAKTNNPKNTLLFKKGLYESVSVSCTPLEFGDPRICIVCAARETYPSALICWEL